MDNNSNNSVSSVPSVDKKHLSGFLCDLCALLRLSALMVRVEKHLSGVYRSTNLRTSGTLRSGYNFEIWGSEILKLPFPVFAWQLSNHHVGAGHARDKIRV